LEHIQWNIANLSSFYNRFLMSETGVAAAVWIKEQMEEVTLGARA